MRPDQLVLGVANRELMWAADETIKQAQRVQAATDGSRQFVPQDVATLSSLRRKAKALATAVQTATSALEGYVLTYIMSLATRDKDLQCLMTHLQRDLKEIVRKVLDATTDDEIALQRVLEESYSQSVSKSGRLHSDRYFAFSDAVFEVHYEYEESLAIDGSSAKVEDMQQERTTRTAHKNRVNRSWIRLWVDALAKCPGGATLFWPLADNDSGNHLPATPQYLFRAFDSKSTGKSDDTVVASAASMYMGPGYSATDILSLERNERSSKLLAHLNKSCYHGDGDDNFMSWSSSFLFVIQYAIWRCHQGDLLPASVHICVLDTTKFPWGQFAKDTWLMKACRNEFNWNPDLENLLRLRQTSYDNGEYLSQGTVYHKHRSCVVSLKALVDAGLFELYPELDEPHGRRKWTNRVKELRSYWADPQATTREEVQCAFDTAKTCFGNLQVHDMALLLLTFKNRHTKPTTTIGQCCSA